MKLTEQAYLVLLALADGPRHGYAIVRAVRDLTDGATTLGAGTLYGLLDRLGDAGLIAAAGEEVVDGRLRRYYRITESGSAAATAETDRLRALARRADVVLRPRPVLGGA